ncbi:MAG: tetratricopeptide repeat protein, partial [Ottowia sp.]|nr:tetratricopeptide repeat protein [Ottowia sp.]
LCLLGVARLRLGQPEEAVASFDAALALAPTQAGIHYDRATALTQLGRHEEALAGFERALTLAPDMRDGWMNRGIALGALGRHTEAIASLERALDLTQRPGAPRTVRGTPQAEQLVKIWRHLAQALRAAGRDPDALGAWEQVLALDDSDVGDWLGMGDVLGALGREDMALDRYRRACELAPDSPAPHKRLATALAKDKKRVSEAIEELHKARELAPQDVSVAFELMHHGMRVALWDDLPALLAQMLEGARRTPPVGMPAFGFLAHPQATAADVLAVARANDPVLPAGSAPAVHTRRQRRERLRVGYLSGD